MEPTTTMSNRTEYTAQIVYTAREREALERFLARRTVAGDVALVESVLRSLLERAKVLGASRQRKS